MISVFIEKINPPLATPFPLSKGEGIPADFFIKSAYWHLPLYF